VSYLQAYGYNFKVLAMAVMIFNKYDELMLRQNRLSGVLNNNRRFDLWQETQSDRLCVEKLVYPWRHRKIRLAYISPPIKKRKAGWGAEKPPSAPVNKHFLLCSSNYLPDSVSTELITAALRRDLRTNIHGQYIYRIQLFHKNVQRSSVFSP